MSKHLILSLICLFVLASCTSTRYLSIDVREPASISLPPQILNIAILDNTTLPDKDAEISANDYETQRTLLDSVNNIFFKALADYISGENFFPSVTVVKNEKPSHPIKETDVATICNNYNVDALVSVDSIGMSIFVYSPYDDITPQSFVVPTYIKTHIYNSIGKQLDKPITFNDTLVFSLMDLVYENENESMSSSMFPFWAAKKAVLVAADMLSTYITPHWVSQERWYYPIGKSAKLKEANGLALKSQWKEAGQLWEKAFEEEDNPSKKIRIAVNTALAKEYDDDIDAATVWIGKAIELLPLNRNEILNNEVQLYRKILEEREKKSIKLLEQFGTN